MTDAQENIRYSNDIKPIPDPTLLTQEASAKLEATLRVLIATELEHQRELFDEKLNSISNQFAERIATLSERVLGYAHQYGEKFENIELAFRTLDARTAEQKSDTKAALDAALAAQKEAVASQTASSEKSITKSETATIERIKAVETLLTASTNAANDKVDDLKSRIVAIEAVKLGGIEQVANAHASALDTRGNMSAIISIITTIIAIASIIITIIVVTKP